MKKIDSTNSTNNLEALFHIYQCMCFIERYALRILKVEMAVRPDSQLTDGLIFKFIQLREDFLNLDRSVINNNPNLKREYMKLLRIRNLAAHHYRTRKASLCQKVSEIDVVYIKELILEEIRKFDIRDEDIEKYLNDV